LHAGFLAAGIWNEEDQVVESTTQLNVTDSTRQPVAPVTPPINSACQAALLQDESGTVTYGITNGTNQTVPFKLDANHPTF
jgi:hypothetical protein